MLATGKLPPDALPGDLASQVTNLSPSLVFTTQRCDFTGIYNNSL